MTDKNSEQLCDELAQIMGKEIKQIEGYGCVSTRTEERIAQKLKEIANQIKAEIFEQLS